MKNRNATISMDGGLLDECREHARKLGLTFNGWINRVAEAAMKKKQAGTVERLLAQADQYATTSQAAPWKRDDIYER